MSRQAVLFWYAYDVILTCVGDYLLKRWSIGHSVRFGVAAYVSYMLMLISGFVLMKNSSELARLSAMLLMLSIVAATVMGVAVFGEQLTNANKVGLGLAAVAVVLLA